LSPPQDEESVPWIQNEEHILWKMNHPALGTLTAEWESNFVCHISPIYLVPSATFIIYHLNPHTIENQMA
jgi:hypothetical protein